MWYHFIKCFDEKQNESSNFFPGNRVLSKRVKSDSLQKDKSKSHVMASWIAIFFELDINNSPRGQIVVQGKNTRKRIVWSSTYMNTHFEFLGDPSV